MRYTAPFTIARSANLRAIAYTSNNASSAEADPVQINVLGSLTLTASTASASLFARDTAAWQATWSKATANDPNPISTDVNFANARHDSAGQWAVARPFLVFPIPGLHAGAQITKLSLVLRPTLVKLAEGGTFQHDAQSYIRVVAASPQNPLSLAAADFGRVTPATLYS